MKLSINELAKLLEMVLNHLQEAGIQKFAFECKDTYYARIWRKDIDFNNVQFMKCPKYTIGSLDDDFEELKNILIGKFEFFSLDLSRIGAILTMVGSLLAENNSFWLNNKNQEPVLSFDELKLLFEIIPVFLKKEGINEIFFKDEDDYYFKIPHEDTNFYDLKFLECPTFVIGSLTDDMADLKKILTGEFKMDGVYMQKLGAILTALGECI